MIIVLNGPLGIGKSTLAEALCERIESCVMLDGDHLVAVNPPPPDETAMLHDTLALLLAHYRRCGYHHAVIDHVWTTREALDDLRRRLCAGPDADTTFICFLLTLPLAEHQQRVERRQAARAIDERAFEWRTMIEERRVLAAAAAGTLGEALDVSGELDGIVETVLRRVGMRT